MSEKLALISVYDKTGLEEFAKRLDKLHFKILSTGQTAAFLKKSGLSVYEVSDYTGFSEILEGRVKTLHPKIHAGILARRSNQADAKTLADLKIDWIDLVVVNLYPFETAPTIDNIDIGGPTMLRAAAKNFERVTVVCEPTDYDRVAKSLETNGGSAELRREMARKVFMLTARYEKAIAHFFQGATTNNHLPNKTTTPTKDSDWSLVQHLRYGENPHQKASLYLVEGGELIWEPPLQGKELSYNNILDADAAWWLMQEFKKEPFACAILKHANPCGVALSKESLVDAFKKAYACDETSAFGGIVIFNREVDKQCAESFSQIFLEVILAQQFSKEALEILSAKKNLRLLVTRAVKGPARLIRSAGGGQLIQETDTMMEGPSKWATKTKRGPTHEEIQALEFAWKVAKHVRSNAVVFSNAEKTLGIGAGQPSRVGSVKVAIMKFNEPRTPNLEPRTIVCASDAFFPFPDNIEELAKAGATAVIQPGGSIKDLEVIAAADKHNLAMVFTGVRHFRH